MDEAWYALMRRTRPCVVVEAVGCAVGGSVSCAPPPLRCALVDLRKRRAHAPGPGLAHERRMHATSWPAALQLHVEQPLEYVRQGVSSAAQEPVISTELSCVQRTLPWLSAGTSWA